MRISLQFLILTLAFFGNSKKSKAKTEGDLIHRKDQKRRAPNMKMKKANGTSKGNHTAERELGTDYQDDYVSNLDLNLDLDLDTVDGKEKFLKKTWDELIEDVERLAEREKWGLKRQPGPLESNFTNDGSFDRWLSTAVESEQDPESEEDWNVLVNFVQGKDSANKKVSSGKAVKGKNMTKEQLRDKEFERQRFFFDPKYKREGIKWVQTTKETERNSFSYKMYHGFREAIQTILPKKKAQDSPQQAPTLWWPHPNRIEKVNKVDQILHNSLRRNLKRVKRISMKESTVPRNEHVGVDYQDISINCDPNRR